MHEKHAISCKHTFFFIICSMCTDEFHIKVDSDSFLPSKLHLLNWRPDKILRGNKKRN